MESWLRLLRSRSPVVRKRAAAGLLQYFGDSVPLPALLDILDGELGLGWGVERILMGRRDPDLFDEMLLRLESPFPYVREVACRILCLLGDRRATSGLLTLLEDRDRMVRCEAARALASLNDPDSGPAMRQHYTTRSEDSDVHEALRDALTALGLLQRRPLTPEMEIRFRGLLRAGQDREVGEGLYREAGLSFNEIERWISVTRCRLLHDPERACPFCGKPLRTNQARQCFECGKDWHSEPDPTAPAV